MSRPIDADELIEILAGMQSVCHTHAGLIYISKLWQQVKHMPTMDAVQVIRCKDCKHSKAYYHGEHSKLGMITYFCTKMLCNVKADDYCSWSERKE